MLLAIALSFVNSGTVVAQNAPTGCPSIMAAGSVSGLDTIVPHGSCITLRAEVVATATTANDYTVSSITYNPPFSFQAGTQINLTSDDYYAAIINLPFDFCFYGNTYTQTLVTRIPQVLILSAVEIVVIPILIKVADILKKAMNLK